jgi:putative endonuclease
MAKTTRAASLGVRAEAVIAEWYQAQGYTVAGRNWRGRGGELDVIVTLDDVVVVVEVKARSSARFGSGLEAITPEKLARLYRLGRQWMAENSFPAANLRVDVASWVDGKWDIVQNVV